MAQNQEVHVAPVPGTSIVFHNPGQVPLHPAAGQPITQVKVGGKVVATSGTVAGVIHVNPA